MVFKLAHISDIHFFHLHKNPFQIFSKICIGNFNAYFNRKKTFSSDIAYTIAPFFKQMGLSHILISGDFTSIATPKEFLKAREFVNHLKDEGFTLYAIPGNHDVYTKKAERSQIFYHSLSDLIDFQGDSPFSLPKDRIARYILAPSWSLITLDSTFSPPPFKAMGLFSETLEHNFLKLLKTLPATENLIIANHFPYKPHRYPKHHLERGDILEEILLLDPRIKAYLHGHRHDLELTKNPFWTVDAGSITLKKKSSCVILSLEGNSLSADPYVYNNHHWNASHA